LHVVSLLERPTRERPSLTAALAIHGSQLALVEGPRSVTYEELAQRVDDAAGRLGATRRLVLLAASNDVDAVVSYLGALHGGHPVLLAPSAPDVQGSRLVDAFDPDVLVHGTDIEVRRAGSAHALHPDLALLLSTSGSTGSPRVVRLSHRNLVSNAASISGYLRLTSCDRAITTLPMQYCYGLSVINSHVSVGAGLVLTEGSVVEPCFWDLVTAHGVTGLAGVPYTFELLDRAGFPSMDLPSLRYVTQAGGRMPPTRVQEYAELGHRKGWELFVMYGQTEATARMAYLPPSLAESNPSAIGIPIPGGRFEIDPVEGSRAGEGELVYRGANVMLGYATTPQDLALGPTVDALRTGDLARRTEAGLYEIVGRRARFAKVLGLRIDLEHLERRLAERSIEAFCTSDDERVVIAVRGGPEVEAAARAVVHGATGLPPSRVTVTVWSSLPRLPNGKPDHCAITRAVPLGGPTRAVGGVPAPPDVDPAVHRAFVDVLQRDDIRGEDTFVELGGDSLSYVEMSIALEEHLGELPVGWHTTAIRDLVPVARPRQRLHQIETSVVLRALSIVVVVGTHIKLFTILGGAHLLLGVAGYNFSRFGGEPAARFRSIARIAVPSMVWLAIASTLDDRIRLPHIFLLNGWFGAEDAHGGYWYVEAIVQILVPIALLLSVPAVRRVHRAHRALVPAALLAAGLLIRFGIVDVPTVEPHDIRPHDILWIFALGWVAAEARSNAARALVSAVVVVSVPGYFGEPARELFVVGGLLLLLWVPTLRLARPAVRVVGAIASASLYIYLTHWQVFPPLREHVGPIAALVGSIVAGVTAWSAVRFGTARWQRVRQGEGAEAGSGASPSAADAPAA
jgi:acyl-CoA synthetase (AMP-forming)/AMP-acid ligase II